MWRQEGRCPASRLPGKAARVNHPAPSVPRLRILHGVLHRLEDSCPHAHVEPQHWIEVRSVITAELAVRMDSEVRPQVVRWNARVSHDLLHAVREQVVQGASDQ